MLHQDQKMWLIFAIAVLITIACSGMLRHHTKTAKQPKMWHTSKNKALGISGHFVFPSHQDLLTEETHGLCQGYLMGQGKWGQSALCTWVADDAWRLWQLPIVALKRTKVQQDFQVIWNFDGSMSLTNILSTKWQRNKKQSCKGF